MSSTPGGEPSFDVAYPEIARHVRKLLRRLRIVQPHEIDDLAQEALLAAAARWASYEPSSPLGAWVGALTRQIVAARSGRPAPDASATDDQGLIPEERALLDERRATLLDLLRPIDDDVRIVFELRELDGFTMGEIASMLGIPVSEAYARLRSARLELGQAAQRRGLEGVVLAWIGGAGESAGGMSFS